VVVGQARQQHVFGLLLLRWGLEHQGKHPQGGLPA
jgi:hypothetical protein